MSETPLTRSSAPHKERLLWLVAIGFFMQTLDATILNTALPAMSQELGESPMQMQSVIVAYALTTAMLIPATGWVAGWWSTPAGTGFSGSTCPWVWSGCGPHGAGFRKARR